MVVNIMSARCRASVLFLFLLGCFLQIQGEVFMTRRAHDVFLRSKRANLFLEEILEGNLERECYEELCNFEEAREYFEDIEMTNSFWTHYYDGNQCEPNPCLHGGNCTDKVGGFYCSCSAPYHGQTCELGALRIWPPKVMEVVECPTAGPTACQQLCTAASRTFICSCMPGFKLQTDGRRCLPDEAFPCGWLPGVVKRISSLCHHRNCPWQVSLMNRRRVELCEGVVLGRFSVLTAARCLLGDSKSILQPYELIVVTSDKRFLPVRAIYVHDRFRTDHHDNDLALIQLVLPLAFGPNLIHLCLPTKDFCENILMHSEKMGFTKRWGHGPTQELAYITQDDCRAQIQVSRPLSNKMFCMKRPNGTFRYENQERRRVQAVNQNRNRNRTGSQDEAESSANPKNGENKTSASEVSPSSGRSRRQCRVLLPGTPVATLDQGTFFLTGLLISSTTDCDDGGLLFSKLSRYLHWITLRLRAAEDHMTPQVMQYPEFR